MEFEEACSEIYYILEHMNPVDKINIPETTVKFFKDNRSILYKVNLDVAKNLEEQELKEETKAFIQILNAKYFLKEAEKKEFNDYLFTEENETQINQNMELTVIKKESEIFLWLKRVLKNVYKKILCK